MSAATTGAGPVTPGLALAQAARPVLWFLRTDTPPLTPARRWGLHWLLRLATAGAFIGHGAYGAVMAKPGWYPVLARLGLDRAAAEAVSLVWWSGGFEMLLGVLVLLLPVRALLLFLVAWKLGSEFVWYPLVGLPAWEFVERWSNYTAPLALLVVRGWPTTWRAWFR